MPDTKAKREWMKQNKKNFSISFMIRTEADIIEELEKHENKAGYIKRLIREDIDRQK